MGLEKFLHRRHTETHFINEFISSLGPQPKDQIELVNLIGAKLLSYFWIPQPEFAAPADLDEDITKDGVYFNGPNNAEFYAQIRKGRIPFWKKYSEQTGIQEPSELMKRWLLENELKNYASGRIAPEILQHQYLGEEGGCNNYVTAMTDVLRAFNIPVKIVFFLKDDEEKTEIKRFAAGKCYGGHFMGACFVEKEWRLYDFKWQWNPNFKEFYAGSEGGLGDTRHRENLEIRYVPVTNNGIYLPDEAISSENIGLAEIMRTKLDLSAFARSMLEQQ